MSRSELHADRTALRFCDVSAVRGGRLIWSQASFEVPAGGIVAVIRAKGTVRPALLQMILGLIPVPSGRPRFSAGDPVLATGSAMSLRTTRPALETRSGLSTPYCSA